MFRSLGKSWYQQQYLALYGKSTLIKFVDLPRVATPLERRIGWLQLQAELIEGLEYDIEIEGKPRELPVKPKHSDDYYWDTDAIVFAVTGAYKHTHEYTLLVTPAVDEEGFKLPQQRLIMTFRWPSKIYPDRPLFDKEELTQYVGYVKRQILAQLITLTAQHKAQQLITLTAQHKAQQLKQAMRLAQVVKPWYTRHHKSVYNQRKLG